MVSALASEHSCPRFCTTTWNAGSRLSANHVHYCSVQMDSAYILKSDGGTCMDIRINWACITRNLLWVLSQHGVPGVGRLSSLPLLVLGACGLQSFFHRGKPCYCRLITVFRSSLPTVVRRWCLRVGEPKMTTPGFGTRTTSDGAEDIRNFQHFGIPTLTELPTSSC
ncbi:hypothetical protein N657DRAFT_505113 [Parathielavia appendiculata]|uniref:Uncharacterized protein n=1 Tax=Parathielavia appendiculata TaxID=2587402 RepID=A0AAN6TX69_9PEZI|nr:hypothetical protein N657DRAFT_505113 [Parathielavia appendiculata]